MKLIVFENNGILSAVVAENIVTVGFGNNMIEIMLLGDLQSIYVSNPDINGIFENMKQNLNKTGQFVAIGNNHIFNKKYITTFKKEENIVNIRCAGGYQFSFVDNENLYNGLLNIFNK